MASQATLTLTLFLTINLLFFTLTSACGCGCGSCPTPNVPTPKPPTPNVPTPRPPTPNVPTPTPPTPLPTPTPPTPTPSPPSTGTCPIDTLKLGVCANVLGLINIGIGNPATTPCCSLLSGLVDLEVAVCLCTALRANILGINLNIPIDLSLLVNYCGRRVPRGFQCA